MRKQMLKFVGEKEWCVQFSYGQVENLTRNCKELCESLHALILILSVKLGPFLAPVPTNCPWSSEHDMTT